MVPQLSILYIFAVLNMKLCSSWLKYVSLSHLLLHQPADLSPAPRPTLANLQQGTILVLWIHHNDLLADIFIGLAAWLSKHTLNAFVGGYGRRVGVGVLLTR